MKKGDVVVVMTMAGEIIGKYVHEKESGITLEDPRTPKIMSINSYVFATPVSDEFEKAYRQAVSGLVL